MADIFLREDAQRLLNGKTVVFIGDSNVRAFYKDMLQLLTYNSVITQKALRLKLEPSFCNDKLMAGTQLTIARDYIEERSATSNRICNVHFFFATRCHGDYMDGIVHKMREKLHPDVVIVASCLWDICRWGPNGVDIYQENLPKLMANLKTLDPNCLVIWLTSLPVSSDIRGAILTEQVRFLTKTLRFDVMEANQFASNVVKRHGFDVLDIHFYLQMQIERRSKDGVHWEPQAVRHVTNLILTHISTAWDFPLPNRFTPLYSDAANLHFRPGPNPNAGGNANCRKRGWEQIGGNSDSWF